MATPKGIKDDGTVSPAALENIEQMALNGSGIGAIASHYKITKRRLQTLMDRNKGDNAIRLAYERGRSQMEEALTQRLLAIANSNSNQAATAAIYLTKSQFQWRDTPEPKAAQVGVVISLPGSYSRDQWNKQETPCFDVTAEPAKAIE